MTDLGRSRPVEALLPLRGSRQYSCRRDGLWGLAASQLCAAPCDRQLHRAWAQVGPFVAAPRAPRAVVRARDWGFRTVAPRGAVRGRGSAVVAVGRVGSLALAGVCVFPNQTESSRRHPVVTVGVFFYAQIGGHIPAALFVHSICNGCKICHFNRGLSLIRGLHKVVIFFSFGACHLSGVCTRL